MGCQCIFLDKGGQDLLFVQGKEFLGRQNGDGVSNIQARGFPCRSPRQSKSRVPAQFVSCIKNEQYILY